MLKKLILIIIAIFLIPVAAEQIQTMSSASKIQSRNRQKRKPIHSALMMLLILKPMIQVIPQKNLMKVRRLYPMILSLRIPVKQKIKKQMKNLTGNPGMQMFSIILRTICPLKMVQNVH